MTKSGGALPVPFVVGTGRCGTTLLRMMLDSHPQLAMPPETFFLVDLLCYGKIPEALRRRYRRDHWSNKAIFAWISLASRLRPYRVNAASFCRIAQADPHFPDFKLEAAAIQERVAALRPFSLPAAIRAFYQMYSSRCQKSRWGDKTPEYLLFMDAIGRVLPEAHFIHVIRDGRDVFLSLKDLWFGPKRARDAAVWWTQRIKWARFQANRLPHYLEIRYEDLIAKPTPTLQRICAFLQLEWDPAMLAYHQRASQRLDELTPTYQFDEVYSKEDRLRLYENTTRPPDASKLERWKTEMSVADCKRFTRVAGALLNELGYALQ